MLSKLMKYELKATSRVFLPLYIALLAFAIINRFMVAIPTPWQTPTVISLAIYVVIMVGMFIMTLLMTIQRFNKNLLSEEGYLMFTLPVRPWQHIVSKMLISMFWVLISTVIAVISALIIAYRAEAWEMLKRDAGPFFRQALDFMGVTVYAFSLEAVIGILLFLASAILLLYASIAIGHLFSRRRILASFAAFIGLNTLTEIFTQIVVAIAERFYHFDPSITSENFHAIQPELHLIIWATLLLSVVIGAAYFAVSNRILSRHLNLD